MQRVPPCRSAEVAAGSLCIDFSKANPRRDGFGSKAVGCFVKAADRFHNHSTMGNAFSVQKQLSYLAETEQLVLPMIKASARLFPLQEAAFENLKLSLKSQISLARPALLLCEQLSQTNPVQAPNRAATKP